MAAAFEVEIQRDVVFATADEGARELKLNTYRAAGAVTAKCLPVGRASAPALSCNTVGENVKLEDAAVKNKLMPCCILVHGRASPLATRSSSSRTRSHSLAPESRAWRPSIG